jgi:hypothetical protein
MSEQLKSSDEHQAWIAFAAAAAGRVAVGLCRNEKGETDELWRSAMEAKVADAMLVEYRKRRLR